MKYAIASFMGLGAIVTIVLSSYSAGPAAAGGGNLTGGPGSNATCASCHTGATLTNAGISLRKKSDNSLVTGKYTPGETYILSMSSMHQSNFRHGFQLMALGADNKQAGEFKALGSDIHTRVAAGVTLVEHNKPIMQQGAVFSKTIEWVAPAAGRGTITIYGVMNAVNNDGTTSGDAVSAPLKITFAEAGVSVPTTTKLDDVLKIYPNPATSALYINMQDAQPGTYQVAVFSLAGNKVYAQQVQTQSGIITVPVAALAAGTYYVQLSSTDVKYNKIFVKQ